MLPQKQMSCCHWHPCQQPHYRCGAVTEPCCPPPGTQAALESVQTGQGTIANPAQEQQVQLWLQALVCGESEAATQVFGLAQDGGLDLQQIRQLLRQAQQTEVAAPTAAAAEDGDGDGEAAPAPAAGPPRPTAKAQSARRQLRKLLQPLAAAQIAASEDED